MFVLGTAGHVDHGKSRLVEALTGIDPDRLTEEKERGMTIDLGFAWLKLPSGREVSIVDVPGHERFIKNMLAGVGGIDLALLVIAADEGVMPQTREHLAILDLLRLEKGIVVITKKDLVDQELLELVTMEVKEVIAGTALAPAPIIGVSAVTGEGLPELVATIDRLLDATQPKRDVGRPRLPIDRVFTIAGFGTVVTGTLVDGNLMVGQEVEILPSRFKARLRGLQTHKRKVETASPGSRVAANLSGLSTAQLERGDVLTTPDWLRPTKVVDVKIELLPRVTHPLRHNAEITFHSNALEAIGKVRLLEKEKLEPGDRSWAQIALSRPVAVVKGDLFVIRSSKDTLGGGEIVDAYPRRHRRFQASTIQGLAAREKGGPNDILLATLEAQEPLAMGELLTRSSLSQSEVEQAIESLLFESKLVMLGDKGSHALLFSSTGWRRLTDKVTRAVGRYHQQFPLRSGMPKEELKSKLTIPPGSFPAAVQQLVRDGALAEAGKLVYLPSHRIELKKGQQAAVDAFLRPLTQNPYSPPSETTMDQELLELLIEQRKVVKVAENVIFAASAYDEMVERVIAHVKSHGKITVAEVRDLFQTSRKYALALMEHLDEQKITRRVGDERVLR
ncbi:MAG: selenocysteine-specific translation elongation factor [Chloroflexi bacterium RBG_13_53_26]|nr:MAG: selenocysteine-specific translation elongation factor [Chloroflexi bacterium RBG_13_53_26]